MRTPLRHRPTTIFSLLCVAGLLLTAVFAAIAANRPTSSIDVRFGPGDGVILDHVDITGFAAPARLVGADGTVLLALPARELIASQELRGTPQQNAAFVARQDRIAALMAEGGTVLQSPDGRALPAFTIPPVGFRLTPDSWVALTVGFLALMGGLWVLVLRPREPAARLFALSGGALWAASLTILLNNESSLATPGRVLWGQLQANHLCALVFSWSLLALFGVYPTRIVPRFVLILVAGAYVLLGVAGLLDPWPDTFAILSAVMVAAVGMTFVLVSIQAWKVRGDPVHRAVVAWVGTALLLSTGLFTAVSFLPQLMGMQPLVGDSLAMSVFLLFYFALAVAITRYRMFDLGQWTIYVVRVALALILILIVDIALSWWVGQKWTLSVAVLLVALAWIPVRARLMQLADRRRDAGYMRLIRGANQVAFALQPSEQAALWREVLAEQFNPLDISPTDAAVAEIREDGRVLAVPSPLGGGALALSHAGKGSRLFDSGDLDMASVLHSLVREMITARHAYDRGVREERLRIARDLHDDVGARLLTGLHMADQQLRPTLQAAMSDIRAIVSGMAGEQVFLERLLGDIRHETARRLEAADIALDWQAEEPADATCVLDYRQHKALTSAFREIVSNVIRHANATRLAVGIAVTDGRLEIRVRDDGDGLPEAALAGETQGYGLRNLRRRMEDINGRLDIRSDSGSDSGSDLGSDLGGTEIRLSMPVMRITAPTATPEQGMTTALGGLT